MTEKPSIKTQMVAQQAGEIDSSGVQISVGDVNTVYGDVVGGDKIVSPQVTAPIQMAVASLSGKGIFISKLSSCERGDAVAIANRARQAGFTYLLVKIADGITPLVSPSELRTLQHNLESADTHLWARQYVRGDKPLEEASAATQIIEDTKLAGYVVDAEIEYKKAGRAAAEEFLGRLGEKSSGKPIGLNSFGLPSYHPEFPWDVFMRKSTFVMPQTYWAQAHNPAVQLQRSFREYQQLKIIDINHLETSVIRDLLTAAFEDEELEVLCYDHFHSVYENFASGMSKGQKVQYLLDYCNRHDTIPDLLTEIQRRHPDQYENFLAQKQVPAPPLPFIPVGAAFAETGWKVSPDEIREFLQRAREMGLPGACFWSWDSAGQPENRDLWEAIASFDWGATLPHPSDGITQTNAPKEALTIEQAEPVLVQEQVKVKPGAPSSPPIPEPQLDTRLVQLVHNDEIQRVIDRLGFQSYIESFAQLVLDEHTRPPLTIGITGAWGSGKSFLLSHICDALDKIQKQAEADQLKRGLAFLHRRERRVRVHIVEFNAWEYSATEVVWAGLVRKILDKMEAESGWARRLWSRVRRNLMREISNVRWKLIPWLALLIAVVIIAAYFTRQNPALLVTIAGSLGLAGSLAIFQSFVNAPMAQWITNLFSEREYGKLVGFMEEIRGDITALRANLPVGSKIVVMLDDLDRCESKKIVEVLEAIKLLLDFDIFIVFMAVDANVITRAIEQHYANTLAEAGRTGYVYLDKIVQIPFRIPEPGSAAIGEYLSALLSATENIKTEDKDRQTQAKKQWEVWLKQHLARGDQMQFRAVLSQMCDTLSAVFPPPSVSQPARVLRRHAQVEALSFAELVWSLLAEYWPVSAYLMHKQLADGLVHGAALTSSQYALVSLAETVKKNIESDIPSSSLRRIADGALPVFDQFVRLNLPLSWEDLKQVLAKRTVAYRITMAFTQSEVGAFRLLSGYLTKNPRHIKRMVNTYSLVRILAARVPSGQLVLSDPESTLKWLIISGQWPLAARLMLDAFTDKQDTLKPGETWPENDNVLLELHKKAMEGFAADEKLKLERDRLDGDPDILAQLVAAGRPVSSKQLDILRAYSINFNPALEATCTSRSTSLRARVSG